ncbi:MAG TPA: GNAT family N-acetyltransferase [Candidatus Eisenbergiella merdipullorum]|uniref:GNAT family N-acetyltransferase n=1 Tax=Candidatus Eisenbergiella merdipullorum TaxID=2838553 RepID=A0A9D2L0E4_9FIRM|nr:GNAT family N-acetyltransferase [Candidatus Eisenbergiella merdipullorum]
MDFLIRKCGPDDIDTVIRLIKTVYEQMEQKDWFAADNGEYTRKTLAEGRGTAYMAVEKESGTPAGVFMTAFPQAPGKAALTSDGKTPEITDDENLGRDIGLNDSMLEKVVHMDSAAVLSSFRGHHLQRRLMEYAEKDLRKKGYRYLCCTVHPDNRPSLNSVLAQGYRIMATCPKYGGYPRHILMKELD